MLSEAQVARDIYNAEEARPVCGTKFQKEVSFEQIVKDKTLSPCSLSEFTDYLVCEEQNAEILQFFTWFCGYVIRWSELSPQDKLLSPPWKPADLRQNGDTDGRSGTPLSIHTHRRARSNRLNQILTILDGKNVTENIKRVSDQSRKKNSDPMNFSTPKGISGTQSSQCPKEQDWALEDDVQRCAKQPFRQEIIQITLHYLRSDAPRRLKISPEDLADCLTAVKTTTHPSALLPAFIASETILKSRSHPSFVARSMRNANAPRLLLIRLLGGALVLLGFLLTLLLVRTPAARPAARAVSLLLWWPGFAMLIAAVRGVCVFLYARNLRQLRPWESGVLRGDLELADDNSDDEDGGDDDLTSIVSSVGEVKTRITSANDTRRKASSSRMRTAAATTRRSRGSMQAFGAANKWECWARKKSYAAMSTRQKIWDDVVRTQNRAVRLGMDRTVLLAVCCGGLLSAVLTVASLFIPPANVAGS